MILYSLNMFFLIFIAIVTMMTLQKIKCDPVSTNLDNVEKKLDSISQDVKNPAIVFSALSNTPIKKLSNEPIRYEKFLVTSNSFDLNSGIFETPFHGIYKFEFHGHGNGLGNLGGPKVEVEKNGNKEFSFFSDATAADHHETFRDTWHMELDQGDKIRLNLAYGRFEPSFDIIFTVTLIRSL